MKKWINSLPIVLLVYFITLMLSTALFYHFENQTLFDSFYWSCITSLTIGYGDISPHTTEMKMIGLVFGHLWILFLIPLIVGNIIVKVLESKDSFTHEEQEEIKTTLQRVLQSLGSRK